MSALKVSQRRAALVQAFSDFLDALVDDTEATKALRTASTPSPLPAKPAPAGAVRARTPAPQPTTQTLPKPLTAAKTPKDLDPAVRAANMPDAVKVATRVIMAVGPDGAILYEGVKGELALQRIPFDDTLIHDAIQKARGAA